MEELAQVKKKKEQEEESRKRTQNEHAFILEEQNIIRAENNDQLKTKRLIDNMMFSSSSNVGNEVCELLANYRGISLDSL